MSNPLKAIILCNNPVALPAIREFLFFGHVAAIVTPRRNKEMQHILQSMLEGSGVPLVTVDKKNYVERIRQTMTDREVQVGLIMTFPYILPEEIWKSPAKGFINFHFGLLPQCRGPQPILRHLLNNDAESGVTLHKVDNGIDTGEVILQEKTAIESNDTYGMLQTKLAYLAAKTAANLVKILSYGTVIPSRPQDESKARYYEMPGADELSVKWNSMTAAEIIRLANACNPWNKGAGALINDWTIGITEARHAGEDNSGPETKAGTILACDEQQGLLVKTSDNQKLKITIIYTNEGFFSGEKLAAFGIKAGMQFQ